MNTQTLVVMAAGIGSRYGGLKQIDPMGPGGEMILDYSVYDALKAGFSRIVFIIQKDMEKPFREKIGYRIEKLVDTAYVFQQVEDIPAGLQVPSDRIKPWGTGHAVLSCRNAVNTPFAVINADDFYGSSSFRLMTDYLGKTEDKEEVYQFCMVGFQLENTLTEHGHVARGICVVDENGYLWKIRERTKIVKVGNATKYTEDDVNWVKIPERSTVSMNMWGFTPGLFSELESRFLSFFKKNRNNLSKAEFFLPETVDALIQAGKAQVKVLPSKERWYGVTYRDDKEFVKYAIAGMVKNGVYPEYLWRE